MNIRRSQRSRRLSLRLAQTFGWWRIADVRGRAGNPNSRQGNSRLRQTGNPYQTDAPSADVPSRFKINVLMTIPSRNSSAAILYVRIIPIASNYSPYAFGSADSASGRRLVDHSREVISAPINLPYNARC